MSQMFDDIFTYLKTRERFGGPIGSFQAIEHRAARVFMDIELCHPAMTFGDADRQRARWAALRGY